MDTQGSFLVAPDGCSHPTLLFVVLKKNLNVLGVKHLDKGRLVRIALATFTWPLQTEYALAWRVLIISEYKTHNGDLGAVL